MSFIKKEMNWSILAWLPLLFYLANLYRMTGHTPTLYIVLLIICGLIGIALLFFIKIPNNYILLISLILFIITGLINCIFINNTDYSELVSDVLYIGIVVVMIVFPMTFAQGFVTFYLTSAVFLLGIATGAETQTFLTSSGNYISILIILAEALYYISIQTSEHRFTLLDILPALLGVIISVWAKGRGGILSCLAMLFLIIVYYAHNYATKDSKRFLIVSTVFLIMIACVSFKSINLMESFLSLGKWSSRGFDSSGRDLIWGSYFGKMKESIIYILNGAPLREIPIIQSFNNNTHNSFLQLHATNGLIVFSLFAAFAFFSFIHYIKHRQYLFAIVLFTMLLRGMTDKYVFGQYGMPIMLYLVLEPYFDAYILQRRKIGSDI